MEQKSFIALSSESLRPSFDGVSIKTFRLPKRMLGTGGEWKLPMSQVLDDCGRMAVMRRDRGQP